MTEKKGVNTLSKAHHLGYPFATKFSGRENISFEWDPEWPEGLKRKQHRKVFYFNIKPEIQKGFVFFWYSIYCRCFFDFTPHKT